MTFDLNILHYSSWPYLLGKLVRQGHWSKFTVTETKRSAFSLKVKNTAPLSCHGDNQTYVRRCERTVVDNWSAFAFCQCDVLVADMTPSGNQRDPLSQYSARMFNGDGGCGDNSETSGNDSNAAVVNGRTDHDTNMSNNVHHFQLVRSAPDNQNNSVQR